MSVPDDEVMAATHTDAVVAERPLQERFHAARAQTERLLQKSFSRRLRAAVPACFEPGQMPSRAYHQVFRDPCAAGVDPSPAAVSSAVLQLV